MSSTLKMKGCALEVGRNSVKAASTPRLMGTLTFLMKNALMPRNVQRVGNDVRKHIHTHTRTCALPRTLMKRELINETSFPVQ